MFFNPRTADALGRITPLRAVLHSLEQFTASLASAHRTPAAPSPHWDSWQRLYVRAQSFPTLCVPIDCSPSGFSVHGISQTRILEWVATSFSRGSSNPSIQPVSSAWQVDSLPLSHLESPQKVLGWPKSLYGFFCNILWKNSFWWTQYNATDFVLPTLCSLEISSRGLGWKSEISRQTQ